MQHKENNINQDLLGHGLQPRRFPILVKLIRKILWPFIRPYHQFHAQNLEQFHQELKNDLLKLNETFSQISQAQDRISQTIRERDINLANFSTDTRFELLSIVNRIAYLESENQLLKFDIDKLKSTQ